MTQTNGTTELNELPRPSFEINESLNAYNIQAREFLTKHQRPWDGLATGVIIFNAYNKVLLLQRASHDSMPNRWEPPGGAVDAEDPTILHGAARELWEEAGLVATRFTRIVTEGPGREPGQTFMNSKRTVTWCRFAFVAEVENLDAVKLDPNEHQDFVWATREEVESQKKGERELPITTEPIRKLLLEAFRLKGENDEALVETNASSTI